MRSVLCLQNDGHDLRAVADAQGQLLLEDLLDGGDIVLLQECVGHAVDVADSSQAAEAPAVEKAPAKKAKKAAAKKPAAKTAKATKSTKPTKTTKTTKKKTEEA